jgi:hypothetical protein
LSLAWTLVPMGVGASWMALQGSDQAAASTLLLAGFAVGPAVGYFDAGLVGRGLGGIALRTLPPAAGMVGAFAITFGEVDGFEGVAGILFAAGCGVALYSAVHDLVTVDDTVIRHHTARLQLGVAPSSDGSMLVATVRF